MLTSFKRSTIDFFQSSFSGFLAAKPSRIADTSTPWAGAAATSGVAAGAAVAGETAEAAGVVADGAVAASIVVLGVVDAAAGAAPACSNIFAIRLVNIPISTKVRFAALLWMHPDFSRVPRRDPKSGVETN
jgi:hypothetical protein